MDGSLDGAAGLRLMGAVTEATFAQKLLHVSKGIAQTLVATVIFPGFQTAVDLTVSADQAEPFLVDGGNPSWDALTIFRQ